AGDALIAAGLRSSIWGKVLLGHTVARSRTRGTSAEGGTMPAEGMNARMDALRHLRGDSWFASTTDVEGADAVTGLEVTADATGWVVDVQLPEDGLDLTDPDELTQAVRRALDAAAALHLLENSRTRMLTRAEHERAAD